MYNCRDIFFPSQLGFGFFVHFGLLILGCTRKVIPPPWYKGGGGVDETPPSVFDMLQYFETILPSVKSLWSSLQGEVYFMGGGAAGGLWRHNTWSPSWTDFIKN